MESSYLARATRLGLRITALLGEDGAQMHARAPAALQSAVISAVLYFTCDSERVGQRQRISRALRWVSLYICAVDPGCVTLTVSSCTWSSTIQFAKPEGSLHDVSSWDI